jgi:hypothetical protein
MIQHQGLAGRSQQLRRVELIFTSDRGSAAAKSSKPLVLARRGKARQTGHGFAGVIEYQGFAFRIRCIDLIDCTSRPAPHQA